MNMKNEKSAKEKAKVITDKLRGGAAAVNALSQAFEDSEAAREQAASNLRDIASKTGAGVFISVVGIYSLPAATRDKKFIRLDTLLKEVASLLEE